MESSRKTNRRTRCGSLYRQRARATLDASVAGFQVGGEVDGTRPHLSEVLVWHDEVAGVAAGAPGTQVGEDVDRAADRAVAATGAASRLHAPVHRRRDDDHLSQRPSSRR